MPKNHKRHKKHAGADGDAEESQRMSKDKEKDDQTVKSVTV